MPALRRILLPIFLLAMAIPARAQTLGTPTWMLYGCGTYGCHTLQVRLIGMSSPGIWRTAFTLIGNWTVGNRAFAWWMYGTNGAWAGDIDHNYLNSGGPYAQPGPYTWNWEADVFTNAPSWAPTEFDLEAYHGPAGAWGPGGASDYSFTRLYATPEPVSLLLLATGLAGIAGTGLRRRRRRETEGP